MDRSPTITETDTRWTEPAGERDRIELRRIRRVPEIINDTFALVRLHRRIFFRSLMTIAFGPMLLTTAITGFVFIRSWMPMFDPYNAPRAPEEILSFFFTLMLTVPLTLIGYALLILLVHELVKMHDEMSPEEMNRTSVREVWDRIRGRLFGMIGTVLVWGIGLFIGIALASLIPFIGTFAIPVIIVYTLLYFPLRIYDRRGLLQSFVVSSQLVSGSFWRTTGLAATLYVMTLLLTGIFIFPMILYSMMSALGLWDLRDLADDPALLGVLGILYFLVYGAAGFFTSGVLLVSIILHYFSQTERKEGRAIAEKIEEIGRLG